MKPNDKPQPTRRDKALSRSLDQIVSDARAQAKSAAGIRDLGDGQLQHRNGATVKKVAAMDGLMNVLTNLGTSQDKRMFNEFQFGTAMLEMEVEELYAADLTARRIVDLLPDDATREGIEWTNPEKSKPIENEFKRLNVWETLNEVCKFARLYGGGCIMLNDGKTPVNRLHEPWEQGSKIESMVALTRWELWAYATQLQRDISKPNFGQPLRYRLFPRMTFGQTAMEIHASRLIRFDGRRLPRLLLIRNNFWHDSVLTPLKESLGDYKATTAAVANVLQGFMVLTHKLAGLTDALNSGREQDVQKRLHMMAMARSVIGGWLMDTEDELEFKSATLSGVGECADIVKGRLQSESDMPHTILFNEGPGGALAGGQAGLHEEKTWYNAVHSWQKNYLKPRLDELMQRIIDQPGGSTGTIEDHAYEFKKLWQLDDKEQAEAENSQAEADTKYITLGVRTPASVQKQRFPEEYNENPAAEDFAKDPTDPGSQEEAGGDQAAAGEVGSVKDTQKTQETQKKGEDGAGQQ